jgi:hypothetical protein
MEVSFPFGQGLSAARTVVKPALFCRKSFTQQQVSDFASFGSLLFSFGQMDSLPTSDSDLAYTDADEL